MINKKITFLIWVLLLFIMILFLTLENVFAESLVPPYAYIDNQSFIVSGNVLDRHINKILHVGAGVTYFDVPVSVTWDTEEDFQTFPYLLIYFKSNASNVSIIRNSTCNTSCFSSAISVVKLGKSDLIDYNYSPTYMYAMIVPYNKMSFYDNWAVYRVDDIFRFSTTDTNVTIFEFDNIFTTKDLSLLNSAFDINQQSITDTQNIINNQNTNTQNIINSLNSASSTLQNTFNSISSTQNQKLDSINNSLNDETGVPNNDVSSKTTEWSSKLAGTGPVSNMVLMPITLLNGYISGFNSTCSPYNLGSLYGTDLILPCIDVSDYVGSSLWNVIDVLFSGFMIYAIGKKFVKIFNDFTNLRDNQMDELYGGGK